MRNLQSIALREVVLSTKRAKIYIIAIEPYEIKKSEIKKLQIGDLIDLGSKKPQIYIYRNGIVVGQAKFGLDENKEVVMVLAKERISNQGKPRPKSVVLDGRVATLKKSDFIVGKITKLPDGSVKNIMLFANDKLFALASLVQDATGYYYRIEEIL